MRAAKLFLVLLAATLLTACGFQLRGAYSLPFDSPALALLPEELYRSAYQPPPLSTKPVPPLTWRLAVFFLQLGQAVSGGSLMDWSASHSWPQPVQRYS